MRLRAVAVRSIVVVLAVTGGVCAAHFGAPETTTPAARAVRPVRPLLVSAVPVAVAPPAPMLPVAPEPAPSAVGRAWADGLLVTGETPHRLVLFTFDDGPERRQTPILLDHLDRAGVKAIFFLTGQRMRGTNGLERDQAEVAREIARRGHLVASHGMDHLPLPTLDDAEIVRQLADEEEVFVRVLGERPWLFRPPGAARTARTDRLVAARGYTTMLWNLGTGDVFVRTPEEVLDTWRRVFDRRERENGDRGGIVLLHDIHPWSVAAFPLIHAELERRNCDLLARGEELYDVVDDPRFFFVPRAGADASVEAPPALPDPAALEARQAVLRERARVRCTAVATR